MKITKGANSIDFEFLKDYYLSIYEEWSQFFQLKSYNWCDITFIHVGFEFDIHLGAYEFQLGLLGLNIRLRIPHATIKSTKTWEEINHQTKLIKNWKTVYISEHELTNLKAHFVCLIEGKRPKKFKGYKKGYLQIGE